MTIHSDMFNKFKTPKKWKKEGVYSSFEEADNMRTALLATNTDGKLEVKVKRAGPGGNQFKVVSYYPPPSENQKTKKGKKK